MKLDLSLPMGAFSNGQSVRGQVVGQTERGSMVLLNGVLARASTSLPMGSQVAGTIGTSAGAATLLLEDEAAATPGSSPGAAFLNKLGLSQNAEGQATLDAMREFGLSTTPENAKGLREFLTQRGLPLTPGNLQAAALVLARRLPPIGFSAALKYLAGNLRFAHLLKGMSSESLLNLQREWSAGSLFGKLSTLLNGSDESATNSNSGLSDFEGLSDTLAFQECASYPPQTNGEGNLYFSWPIFWSKQDLPDTLEGEAFYPPRDREDLGFSLRVVVSPPRLGPMEVGLHRLKQSLWIHFSTGAGDGESAIRASFHDLETRLSGLGWKEIRLTSGPLSERNSFFSQAPGGANRAQTPPNLPRFDRRI